MKPTRMMNRRIAVPLAFLGALAGTWGVRAWLWGTDDSVREGGVISRIPEWREPAARRSEGVKVGELVSVRNGVVRWVEGGDVNAAFAAGWRALRPLAEAGGRDGDQSNREKARQLFADWWRADPEGALRFVSEKPGAFGARGGMYLLPLVAERNAREAWRLADLGLDKYQRMAARGVVMDALGRKSREEAEAFIKSLPPGQQGEARNLWLMRLVGRDVKEALAYAAGLPEDAWDTARVRRDVAQLASAADPGAFLEAVRTGVVDDGIVMKIANSQDRESEEWLGRLARAGIANADAAEGVAFCEWALKKGGQRLASAAWSALLEKEGVKTADQVAALSIGLYGQKDEAEEAFCAGLGTAAPEAGLAWALAKGVPLKTLIKAWCDVDAGAALTALRGVPSSPEVVAAQREAVRDARMTAPVQALETWASLPPEPGAGEPSDRQQRDLYQLIRLAGVTDPVRTLGLMHVIPNVTPEVVSTVLTMGGNIDPQGTAAALAQVELPVTDSVAAESFTRGWAAKDAEAASVWVRGLEAGEMREGAAAGLARSAAKTDPQGALAWAVEITQPDMRRSVLRKVVESAAQSGVPLETFLAAPGLTADERATLGTHGAKFIRKEGE